MVFYRPIVAFDNDCVSGLLLFSIRNSRREIVFSTKSGFAYFISFGDLCKCDCVESSIVEMECSNYEK